MVKVSSRKSIIALICIVLCIFLGIFYLLNSNQQKDAQSAKVRALNRSIRSESEREVRTAKTLENRNAITDKNDRKLWKIWVSNDHTTFNVSRSFKSKLYIVDQLVKSDHKVKYHVIFPFRGWIQGGFSTVRLPPLVPLMLHQPVLNKISEDTSPCQNLSNFQKDSDFKGGDLEGIQNPVQVSSPQECCEACSITNGCGHWTHTPEGSCWLKNPTTLTEASNPGLTSGVAYKNMLHRRNSMPMNFLGPPKLENRPELPCCELEAEPQVHPNSKYSIEEFKKSILTYAKSSNSGKIMKTEIVTGNWDEQLLIGNGKLGAMVGGTAEYEVIPISISNFFGYNKIVQAENPPADPSSDGKSEPNVKKATTLNEARTCLGNKEHKCAAKYFRKFQKENLGMFEYVADLGMIFSPVVLKEKQVEMNREGAVPSRKNNIRFQVPPPPNGPRMGRTSLPLREGRRGIVESLRFNFDQASDIQNNLKNPTKGNLLNNAVLYLDEGVTSAQSITFDADSLHLHSKQWYASEKYNLLVGRVSGISLESSNSSSDELRSSISYNNLNVALKLHRPVAPENPEVHVKYFPYSLSSAQLSKLRSEHALDVSNGETFNDWKAIAFEMELASSENHIIPATVMCGVSICKGERHTMDSYVTKLQNPSNVMDEMERSIVCNEAKELDIYISIMKVENMGLSIQELEMTKTQLPTLKQKCHDLVSDGLSAGYDSILMDHKQLSASRMNRIQFDIVADNTNTNGSKVCPALDITDRLDSFGKGCFNTVNNTIEKTIFDEEIVVNTFQYGRHLLLSSGSQSVSNLQGLWGDHFRSVWNGDYHLNINTQMIYWAAGNGQLEEVFNPLLSFIDILSKKGQITAQEMYSIKRDKNLAWVAHGFTDSTVQGAIFGDLQWSLCVTCGAWVAMHLFDSITYRPIDYAILENKILPIFRGILYFFMDYIFFTAVDNPSVFYSWDTLPADYKDSPEKYIAHTGPTSSPENSYKIPLPGANIMEILAFSPAIDISTLRQVVNMFQFMVSSMEHYSPNGLVKFQADRQLIDQFETIIKHFPNHAVPFIHPTTHRVMEYPDPLMHHWVSNDPHSNTIELEDDIDAGHRHFSGMHWLYPSTFLPYSTTSTTSSSVSSDKETYQDAASRLYDAARETLLNKRQHGGGHTSWSAAWEAILWARLFDGDKAQDAVDHLLSKYLTQNFLSLHPPLMENNNIQGCTTCFQEMVHPKFKLSIGNGMQSLDYLSPRRGLITPTDAKFQLDGNMGYVAAILEMLLQTHLPSTIVLLPALPTAWQLQGHIYGLRGRGDINISFAWKRGKIEFVYIQWNTRRHPWWTFGQEDTTFPGFFHPLPDADDNKQKKDTMEIHLVAPNRLAYMDIHEENPRRLLMNNIQITHDLSKCSTCSFPPIVKKGMKVSTVSWEVQGDHPIAIYLCGVEISKTICLKHYQEFVTR